MGRINSISDLRHYVGGNDYVSFDLFDTLIKRQYLRVNEVHDTVSAYVLAQIGQMHQRKPGDLTSLRYRMCTALKGAGDGAIQEPEIGCIWDHILAAHVGDAKERAEIVERVVSFEHSIELQNLQLIDGAFELLSYLKSEKKVLVAISDMYFSLDHMRVILTKLGIFELFDHVFVSADIGLTKQTGDLFRYVQTKLSIASHNMLHVGDNLASDIDMASQLGIATVHVDQPSLLELERPDYGKRIRVEQDIADVVKAHLFSVLLDAHSRKAGQIYFMARDGLTISSFLRRWQSRFRDTYLPSPGHEEMYLNRVLTIWANVDFSVEWLPHAVGIAFWLKEGAATAAELSELFGLSEVPAELGEGKLTSVHDTFRVANAYRAAGLEQAIRTSILKKRGDVERYLRDIGFYDHSSVIVSDVGYSGTVARALNTLLMQRSAECSPHVPPSMVLHLIVTHHNYEVNRSFALPFCEFTDRLPFPVASLPDSLSGSYSWLEYFFKHPTLRPIVGLREEDGRLVPELSENPVREVPFPSERLLEFAMHRDEDIVLLWMAATNNFNELTEPLVNRFSNPDEATIAQMRDEVYELDPITGTTRSLLLEIPGTAIETVAEAARKGDYWIAGSIAVSHNSGEFRHSMEPAKRPKLLRRRGPLRWLRSRVASIESAGTSIGFEADFYGSFYPDLRIFHSAKELRQHYINHGRRENRVASRRALRARLLADCGPLPENFDWEAYRSFNPDLEAVADTPERALDHYMRSGRAEGRRFELSIDDVANEFEILRGSGLLPLTTEERTRVDKGESTMAVFLRRHRISIGSWIHDLELADFRALHRHWAGDVGNRAEAIVALCEKGLERMPSLSMRTPFDASYYRSHAPDLTELDNADLYRHYLNRGCSSGLFPSEQALLQRIWGQENFPRSFDWKAWQNRDGMQETKRSRCDFLKDFIDAHGVDKSSFVKGEDAAQFLEFLGMRAWSRHRRIDEARSLFNAAIAAGGNAGWLEHLLGDLEAEAGNTHQALRHYRNVQGHPTPHRWSYLNAADLQLRHGDYATALAYLEAGRSAWHEAAPWRRLYDRAMQLRSAVCAKRVAVRPGGAKELMDADQLVADIASRVPAFTSFDRAAAGVVIFTGRPLTASRDIVKPRDVTVRHLGDIESSDYLGTLLQHKDVIFHEVPFTHHVLHAILIARSLGKRTTLWLGDLRHWKGLDLDQTIWGDVAEQSSSLRRTTAWEMALVARYCDAVVTTLAGCSRGLALLAPRTPCEKHIRRYSNVRGNRAERRTALILASDDADDENLKRLAEAIERAASLNSRLMFLVDGKIAKRREVHNLRHRIEVMESDPPLPLLAAAIATADLVVQSVSGGLMEPYAAWSEAETAGVPAIVVKHVPAESKVGKRIADGTSIVGEMPLFNGDLAAAMAEGFKDESSIPTSTPIVVPSIPDLVARTSARKMRILFINLWFPPQVIGGATRVLTDNVDYILDNHGDEFELAAFASDELNDRCGEFTLDTYRGMPVFRIATPQEPHIYWRSDNAMAAARFASVLDSFQPDLVHIHCLQKMGGTIADVCRNRDVPYIVSLHDAWWISDFPFLSDTRGMPAIAQKDYYLQSRLKVLDPLLSATRAQRLRETLLAARHRLAVSKSFRDVYERCGIPCDVIENGASRIARKERTKNAAVHLCHIGGLERHKGAYLIEAALKTNKFANLHLTLIDLARTGEHITNTVWGTTPVSITGKMSSDELAELYARSNVLLAPSTCEESFGLASREALAHGLWVVAGDRGAMAEPIVPGQNGYIVSIDDASELAHVLREIDQDPDRYKRSPELQSVNRTADDQSRDLINLYRMFRYEEKMDDLERNPSWLNSYDQPKVGLSASSGPAI